MDLVKSAEKLLPHLHAGGRGANINNRPLFFSHRTFLVPNSAGTELY